VPPPARDYGSSEEIEGDEDARAKFAKDKDSTSEPEEDIAEDPNAGNDELKGGGSNWVASFERAYGAGAAERRQELEDEVQDWEKELDDDGPIAQAMREGKAKGKRQVTTRDEGAMFDSVHSGEEGEEGMGSDLEELEDDAGLDDHEGLEDVDLEREEDGDGDASEAVVRSSDIEEGVDDEEGADGEGEGQSEEEGSAQEEDDGDAAMPGGADTETGPHRGSCCRTCLCLTRVV
jgi:hypothetical protein